MLALLEAWRAAGSSRLDRDLDGVMDAGPAPAIWDELYPRLLDAVMGDRLGPQLKDLEAVEGDNNSTGSGFTGGGIDYIDKDLRTLLGDEVQGPVQQGLLRQRQPRRVPDRGVGGARRGRDGDRRAQHTEAPGLWKSDANAERIEFAPGLLTTTIRYTNRPSGIQQVISFTGHRAKRN